MIKKILAWLIVLVTAYVILFSFFHPTYLYYYETENDKMHSLLYPSADPKLNKEAIPIGQDNILMKEKNPFVFYALKYQGWYVLLAVLIFFSDIKFLKSLTTKCKSFLNKLG